MSLWSSPISFSTVWTRCISNWKHWHSSWGVKWARDRRTRGLRGFTALQLDPRRNHYEDLLKPFVQEMYSSILVDSNSFTLLQCIMKNATEKLREWPVPNQVTWFHLCSGWINLKIFVGLRRFPSWPQSAPVVGFSSEFLEIQHVQQPFQSFTLPSSGSKKIAACKRFMFHPACPLLGVRAIHEFCYARTDDLAGRGCKCFVVAALAGRPAAGLGAVKSAMFTGQIIWPVNMRHGKNKENIRLNNLYPNTMSQTQNMWVLWDIVRLSVFCALWGVCY